MIGVVEDVGRGLVNRNGARLGSWVGRLSAMNGQGADSLLGLIVFVCGHSILLGNRYLKIGKWTGGLTRNSDSPRLVSASCSTEAPHGSSVTTNGSSVFGNPFFCRIASMLMPRSDKTAAIVATIPGRSFTTKRT